MAQGNETEAGIHHPGNHGLGWEENDVFLFISLLNLKRRTSF